MQNCGCAAGLKVVARFEGMYGQTVVTWFPGSPRDNEVMIKRQRQVTNIGFWKSRLLYLFTVRSSLQFDM